MKRTVNCGDVVVSYNPNMEFPYLDLQDSIIKKEVQKLRAKGYSLADLKAYLGKNCQGIESHADATDRLPVMQG